ncbi:MAG: type VI secretion system protein TssA [Gammaproteobacteria bacterium]|nr:type VI secretion system protein TssA [Gammaproteobacteria bacterium]
MQELIEQIDSLLVPISADKPCGSSAKYETEYESIQEEIDKQNSLDGAVVDWNEISNLATTILTGMSKDILVASYYANSRFVLDGYQGLAEALMLIDTLFDRYWDDLYPEKKRMRGRVVALTWLSDELEKGIETQRPDTHEIDAVKSCLALLESIDARVKEKIENEPPDFTKLVNLTRGYVADVEKAERDKARKAEEAAAKKAAGIVDIGGEADLPKAFKQIQNNLQQVIAYLRNSKPKDPRSYRLSRTAMWIGIDSLPPDENGVTQIKSPGPDTLQRFETLLKEEKHAELLLDVEQNFIKMPLWLDAHWFAYQALDAMGPEWDAAKQAVIVEVSNLLARVPDILNLQFSDNMPFCSAECKKWVRKEVMAAFGGAIADEDDDEGQAIGGWEEELNKARALLAKGRFNDGLLLLSKGVRQAGIGREQFLWRLAQANFCFEGKLIEMAIPQLEYLDQQVKELHIAQWEPELEAEVLRLLLRCYDLLVSKRVAALPVVSNKAQEVYERLCRIDLDFALTMEQSQGTKKIIHRMFEVERR